MAPHFVAVYLITCPSASSLGIYYLPQVLIEQEVGLTDGGAQEALSSLVRAGFCEYNWDDSEVWIPEMARFQIAETLKPSDNRHGWVLKELQTIKKSSFFRHFMERYREPFNLPDLAPTIAPLEPLQRDKALGVALVPALVIGKAKALESDGDLDFETFWRAYPARRRKSKATAHKAWKKIKPSLKLLEQMLLAVEAQSASQDWLKDGGQFIPYPASWLNAHGWLNEVTPLSPISPKTSGNLDALRNFAGAGDME